MLLTLEQVNNIIQQIAEMYGYYIGNYDPVFLQRRLQSFALQHNCRNFLSVKQRLLQDELLLRDFISRMTINISEMFRDPHVFAMLRNEIIAAIACYPIIKIWSVGCADGQEVYSLAILLSELGIYERCVLYATDVSAEAIKRASAGAFAVNDLVKFAENYYLSGGRQKFSKYFSVEHDRALINSEVRKNICFAHHNLVSDGCFNTFNLILCRNMLIYFNEKLQQRAVKLFSNSLEAGGFLVLGQAESLVDSGYMYFNDYNLSNRIYKAQS